MADKIWKLQDHCRGLAAQANLSADRIYQETGAAKLEQGSLAGWQRIKADMENLQDFLSDLENNLTTITGGE